MVRHYVWLYGYITSLSVPHTSVTAFVEVVCMLAVVYRKCVFMKTERPQPRMQYVAMPSLLLRRWRATARVQHRCEARGMKMTQVNTRLATADHGRQTWEVASSPGHSQMLLRSCGEKSGSGLGMRLQVLLTMLMEQQTVANSAVIHGLRAMTSAMHCLLAQARPHDDKLSD